MDSIGCIKGNAHSSTPLLSSSLSLCSKDNKSVWMGERDARKYAEKQRRAKFNAEIHELAKIVPHGADGQRKMEKMEILRLATHGLRLKYIFNYLTIKGDPNPNLMSSGVSDKSMTNAFLHLMNSFFLTLTCNGQILLVSSNVEEMLGYNQCDLYGQNILQITHPKDRYLFRDQLIPTAFEQFCEQFHLNVPCPRQKNIFIDIDKNLQKDRRSFTVRLVRSSGRFDKPTYELVKIDGCFRRSDTSIEATPMEATNISLKKGCGRGHYPLVSQIIRRSNYPVYDDSTGTSMPHMWQHEMLERAALHGVNGNDIIFVAMVRIIRPPKLSNWPLEANRLEYKTRHLIDGRIVDCDHRISLVAGYLSSEVQNLSPFSFMHQDDVRWVVVALRQMYDCNSYFGESFYRLLSRNGNFIYLHTKGFMEIDKSTNQVHSFVCINTLLDETIGSEKIQEMKNKFSVIINTRVPQTKSRKDLPASQNPQQLERIVLYLIENLQKRDHNDVNDEHDCDDNASKELQNCNNDINSQTALLDLVPPEPATVRSSITRSIDIINKTNCEKSVIMESTKNDPNNIENECLHQCEKSQVDGVSRKIAVVFNKKFKRFQSLDKQNLDNAIIPLSKIRFIKIQKPIKPTKLSITCQVNNHKNLAKTIAQTIHHTNDPLTLSLEQLYCINNNNNNNGDLSKNKRMSSLNLSFNKLRDEQVSIVNSTTSPTTNNLYKIPSSSCNFHQISCSKNIE